MGTALLESSGERETGAERARELLSKMGRIHLGERKPFFLLHPAVLGHRRRIVFLADLFVSSSLVRLRRGENEQNVETEMKLKQRAIRPKLIEN